MKNFQIKAIKGDIFGGLTAGVVALPLALAFGMQSGLGVNAGLYGAIFLGFFAALFGGTKTQISGPTGPMTVVSASVISSSITMYGGINNALTIILLTFFLAGVFQIVFGLVKIGKYIKFIPFPVLSGFMSGIGIIIILLQLFPAAGLNSPGKIIEVIYSFPELISNFNFYALFLSVLTILIIYFFPKITKIVPSTLIALISVSVLNYLLQTETPLIGEIKSGIPHFQLFENFNFDWSAINLIVMSALTLAGLGTIDSLLTSVVADNLSKEKHNSNKELIGQGIGNLIASVFGGIPGAGATMRTVVNIKSGGKTQISGIIHSLFLFGIILGLGKYVAFIPLAVLAGILITVGVSIIDFKGLKNLLNFPKSDAFVLILVLLLTVFVDLLQAVGLGMILASLIFMRKASEAAEQSTSLQKVNSYDKEIGWQDEKDLNLEKFQHVYIKRFEGPIFFGIASKILERIKIIPADAKVIIFRMKRVPYIDQSGLIALREVITEMQRQNITVVMTKVQPQPMYLFKKNAIIPEIIPEDLIFDDINDCTTWLNSHLEQS